VDRLEAEEPEARVVTPVRVRQEDSIDRRAIDACRGRRAVGARTIELPAYVGCCVDQMDLSRVREQNGKTGDQARRVVVVAGSLAVRAGAAGVRKTAVLYRAEHEQSRPVRAGDPLHEIRRGSRFGESRPTHGGDEGRATPSVIERIRKRC
jgi:hypothetical protein